MNNIRAKTLQQKSAESFLTLTGSMAGNQKHIFDLAQANVVLTTTNQNMATQMVTLVQHTHSLQMKIDSMTGNTQPSSQRKKKDPHHCWPHGKCAHNRSQCCDKKEGHKYEATFQNKMGGVKKELNGIQGLVMQQKM